MLHWSKKPYIFQYFVCSISEFFWFDSTWCIQLSSVKFLQYPIVELDIVLWISWSSPIPQGHHLNSSFASTVFHKAFFPVFLCRDSEPAIHFRTSIVLWRLGISLHDMLTFVPCVAAKLFGTADKIKIWSLLLQLCVFSC